MVLSFKDIRIIQQQPLEYHVLVYQKNLIHLGPIDQGLLKY